MINLFIRNVLPESTYNVLVSINDRCIWRGEISGHVRNDGAAPLLRAIAAKVETEGTKYRHAGSSI